MIAQLIRADGSVAREWRTDNPAAALTADRNCPVGWNVRIRTHEGGGSGI